MCIYLLQQTEAVRKWKRPPLPAYSYFLFSRWQMRTAYFSCTNCSPATSSPNYTPNEKQTACDTHSFHTVHTHTHKTQSTMQEPLTAGWMKVRLWGKEVGCVWRLQEQEPVNTPAPFGVHSFTFPNRLRSAWRNRSLWNTKRSYTADTASTVTPCSFHSMLAAAHHRLPSIQPQQQTVELLWKLPRGSLRSPQCLI